MAHNAILQGRVITRSLTDAPHAQALNQLIAGALELARANVAECQAALRMMDPKARAALISTFPDDEAWRAFAAPGLTHVVDALRHLSRGIPEAQTQGPASTTAAATDQPLADILTDEVQLRTDGSAAG